jgi:hypothetical protein
MPNKLNRPEIFGLVRLLENIGNLLGEAFSIMRGQVCAVMTNFAMAKKVLLR